MTGPRKPRSPVPRADEASALRTRIDELENEADALKAALAEEQARSQDAVKKLAAYQVPYSIHVVLKPRHYERLANQCRAHGVAIERRVDQILRAAYPTPPEGGTIPLADLRELQQDSG